MTKNANVVHLPKRPQSSSGPIKLAGNIWAAASTAGDADFYHKSADESPVKSLPSQQSKPSRPHQERPLVLIK